MVLMGHARISLESYDQLSMTIIVHASALLSE
jgi:hypothetical protein